MTLELETIQLSYARNQHVLFSDLDIQLMSGQGLLVYGPNGCGKTTLLRILAGLINPTEGDVTWNGKSIFQSLSAFHQSAHYLGHAHGIKNQLTVKENVIYSQSLNNSEILQCSDEALKKVLLHAHQSSLAMHLSAGQKRRLALTRLFSAAKPLWILDEPFTNLDTAGQKWFSEILEEHFTQGGMAIITSHQPLTVKHLHTLALDGNTHD